MSEPGSPIEFISRVEEVTFPDEWYRLSNPEHFWFQWRFRAALRQVREVGPSTGTPALALEIGCGQGVLRDQFEAATPWTVDATDLHLPALTGAGRGRGRTLYYNILQEDPGFVRAYDVVILFDVLEHIVATGPFVRSVLRHLKPGGHLLLNVPALGGLFSAYDVAAGHVRRYDPSSLVAEFAGHDLRVLDVRYWGLSLVPLLLLRKLVLRGSRPAEQTIRSGFRPPGSFTNALLRTLMRVETTLLSCPPLGTSLLLCARKGP